MLPVETTPEMCFLDNEYEIDSEENFSNKFFRLGDTQNYREFHKNQWNRSIFIGISMILLVFDWISLIFTKLTIFASICKPVQGEKTCLRKFLLNRFSIRCLENTFPGSLRPVSWRSRCVKLLKIVKIIKFQRDLVYAILIFWRRSSTTPDWIYCSSHKMQP